MTIIPICEYFLRKEETCRPALIGPSMRSLSQKVLVCKCLVWGGEEEIHSSLFCNNLEGLNEILLCSNTLNTCILAIKIGPYDEML